MCGKKSKINANGLTQLSRIHNWLHVLFCFMSILGIFKFSNYKPPGRGGYDLDTNWQLDGGSPGFNVRLL